MMPFPVAPPVAMMSISFESDKVILEKLRERLRRMCASIGNSSDPATVSETVVRPLETAAALQRFGNGRQESRFRR